MSNAEANWNALYTGNTGGIGDLPSFLSHTLPISKLELSISARKLLNLDILSKSDPQCIVYERLSPIQKWRQIGKTEVIRDSLNPDFVTKIYLDYSFEKVQYLKFELWDIDINDHDFLGEVCTTLPDVVASRSRQFIKPILNKNFRKECGQLILFCEELSACKQLARFKFRVSSIKTSSCFSLLMKPTTFLKILRSNEDNSHSVVHETAPKWYTKNPEFDPIQLKVRSLCNGDLDRMIRIDVMHYSSTGDHQLIGSVSSSLNQLAKKDGPRKFEIKNKAGKTKGELLLEDIALSDAFTFFDYLRGGCELNFAVAVDFTQSNGPVEHPSSLHFIDTITGRPNNYEIAIQSLGEIIQFYSSSKMFPAFGFGAKVPPSQVVSHRFALNGVMEQPYCEGVEGLLYHYRQNINKVILYGPTNFSPIIEYTAQIASKNTGSSNYFVLLIITDGVICDLENTKRSIIRASSLPMSIIIVGVGSADFSAMTELDSDEQRLEQDGRKAARDIVQFVSMKDYLRSDGSLTNHGDLARDVLYELPEQVEDFFKLHNIKPGFGKNPGAP